MPMVKTVPSFQWLDGFLWIQVLVWCKDCVRDFAGHRLHSIYQWHQAAVMGSKHPEVHMSIDFIKP